MLCACNICRPVVSVLGATLHSCLDRIVPPRPCVHVSDERMEVSSAHLRLYCGAYISAPSGSQYCIFKSANCVFYHSVLFFNIFAFLVTVPFAPVARFQVDVNRLFSHTHLQFVGCWPNILIALLALRADGHALTLRHCFIPVWIPLW